MDFGVPYDWPCPTCGAVPGVRCRAASGRVFPAYVHATRGRLAWPREGSALTNDYPLKGSQMTEASEAVTVQEVHCTCPRGWNDPRRHSGWCALTGAPNKRVTENRFRVVGEAVSAVPVRMG